jgi:glycosyltransferase involved in cell wall biosynthesis
LRDLLLSTQPDIARRLYSPAFSARLQLLLKKSAFDLIQFEGIEVACYLPLAHQTQPDARLCFDTFNAEYALQRTIFEIERHEIRRWPAALYSLVQSRRIARFERRVCQQADWVIAVSLEDADLLRRFRPDGRLSVIPSGIFTENYAGGPKASLGENALVFTGKMDYRPNVDAVLWFANESCPGLWCVSTS